MSLNFDVNSKLHIFRKKVSHYGKIVKMCQFYSDSSRFFCNQLYLPLKRSRIQKILTIVTNRPIQGESGGTAETTRVYLHVKIMLKKLVCSYPIFICFQVIAYL
jgi:hypothetical protein